MNTIEIAINEFNKFANKSERIKVSDGSWSASAVFIIIADYCPRKNEKVHINYDECNAGSTQFHKWLNKFGFTMEWIEPAIVGIYKNIKVSDPLPQINNELIEYGLLPTELLLNEINFCELWNMIPADYNLIQMFGKTIQAPRKYKVYGTPYKFTGMTDIIVDDVPLLLQPYLDYINTLDGYLYNSVLINWYEGTDYIGFHSDKTSHLNIGSNIYGISFGEKRTLRFKDEAGTNTDYILENNSIINMKHGCQEVYKHSILKSKKLTNKRINITFRSIKV